MPPKKQKAQKMALADFFADTTTGGSSWADDPMEALPTAPAARTDTGPRRGEPGYLDSMPDRGARTFGGAPSMREELPLPEVPPFTAFIGNLTFETEEPELRDFFDDLNVVSVRLVKDPQGKPKGFGYVEFAAQDGLKGALDRSGANLAGRSIRVNVAEAPSSTSRFAPSVADESSQWRRATPLPQRESPQLGGPRRNFSGMSTGSDGGDRDWSSARGAKFTPSRESSGYGQPREHREQEHHHSHADDADKWRSARPLVEATPSPGGAPGGREAPPHRPAGPADTESTWSRGTRVAAPPAVAAEPAARKRLNLAPRSAAPSGTPSPESSTPNSKANPFGAAKPIDTATREREAAEHAEKRRAEAAAAREKADAQRKAAAERREKEREQERANRPVKVHPSRMPKKEAAAPAEKDEDGFEAVAAPKGRGAGKEEDKAAPAPAKTGAKSGFSFAAAAGQLDGEVDEVADKVAEVQV